MDTIPTYDATGTSTAELLVTGAQRLHTVEVENPNTSIVYIQLFDAASAGAVTVGTTTPNITKMVPPGDGSTNGVRLLDWGQNPPRFNSGIVYAVTTTRSGSGNPTTACPLNFTHS